MNTITKCYICKTDFVQDRAFPSTVYSLERKVFYTCMIDGVLSWNTYNTGKNDKDTKLFCESCFRSIAPQEYIIE